MKTHPFETRDRAYICSRRPSGLPWSSQFPTPPPPTPYPWLGLRSRDPRWLDSLVTSRHTEPAATLATRPGPRRLHSLEGCGYWEPLPRLTATGHFSGSADGDISNWGSGVRIYPKWPVLGTLQAYHFINRMLECLDIPVSGASMLAAGMFIT